MPPFGESERALGHGNRDSMLSGFAKLLDAVPKKSLPLCSL